MKRKYVKVKMEILTVAQDIVTLSGVSDDPNVDDGYDLSGFAYQFQNDGQNPIWKKRKGEKI